MKTLIPLTALAALFASSSLSAETPAFSKPSGYETLVLKPGFNFIGLRLHESVVASGTFTSNTSSTLVDSTANFSLLSPGELYLVEFTGSGSLEGLVLEVPANAFDGNMITGLSGINADYLSSYQIRAAKTIGDIFGSGSNVLLTKGTIATADVVFIPKVGGGFNSFYHSADVIPFPGATPVPGKWETVGSPEDKSGEPINYLDGFYVQIRSSEKSLVVTGQVKLNSTLLPAVTGFSYFSSFYPAGTTLTTSGLADVVQRGTIATADVVYLPNPEGGFLSFYHSLDTVPFPGATPVPGKWETVGNPNDQGNQPITSGFIFQRRGNSDNLKYKAPSFYQNL